MATTSYGVNHALAVKLWSRKLMHEALKQTWAGKFFGKTSDSLIQIKDDTQKSAGDKVTVGLRMQLSGNGVAGDGTLEGNEEALTTYSDAVLVDQLRHAVRSAGKMSEQRVPFSVREEARMGLQDWWAGRFDTSFFNQLCGYTAQSDTRFTGNNTPVAPDTAHRLVADTTGPGVNSADENIVSADTFDLSWIDYAKELAENATPVIRPIMVNGEAKYVMFIHSYQATDLRTNTSTGQWLDIQKAAMQGGQVSKNPIYTGALGEYNGVILHSSTRVTNGVNSSSGAPIPTVKRAALCGAQAGCLAFGRDNGPNRMTWVEELFDYKNQLGVSAGCIYGLKKTRFNSADFSTVVVSTYGAAHA